MIRRSAVLPFTLLRQAAFAGAIACAVFTAPLSLGADELAEIDAETALARMNKAFAELSYDGVFSYYNGSDVATLRVVHKVIDGVQRERLVHLNGAPREILRLGEDVECIVLPGDELLKLEGSIPAGPFARVFTRQFESLSNVYALSYFGEDRVAGREAVRLAVTPLDDNRYGYRLWLDKATYLLLRSDLVDARGDRLEIFQFSHLVFGDAVNDADLEAQWPDGSHISHLTLSEDAGVTQPHAVNDPAWHARWLPEGFSMAAADLRHTSALKAVNTLMYSDGLATFSVFIEDMPEGGAASMVSRNGATVAVTQMAAGPDKRHHLVTLVGELPTPTARRIAESIYYEN